MDDVELFEQSPTPLEHTALRAAAGLSAFPEAATSVALAGSWFAVVARDHAGAAVGMGRMIGDGAIFLHVVDMAVRPERQGQGIGSRILRCLLDRADTQAPHAYISLIADPAGQSLYRAFGFSTVGPSIGMKRRH